MAGFGVTAYGRFSGDRRGMEIFEAGIDDVLSYLHYPPSHRTRLCSNNPIERLNLEIRRRTRVVGMYCTRLFGHTFVQAAIA